jgi:hypothetical protein
MAVSFRLVELTCVCKSAKLTLLFLEYSFDFKVSAALEVALSFFFSFAKKSVARKEAMLLLKVKNPKRFVHKLYTLSLFCLPSSHHCCHCCCALLPNL